MAERARTSLVLRSAQEQSRYNKNDKVAALFNQNWCVAYVVKSVVTGGEWRYTVKQGGQMWLVDDEEIKDSPAVNKPVLTEPGSHYKSTSSSSLTSGTSNQS